jgi:quercetin dioxygenase-like cupin family protein
LHRIDTLLISFVTRGRARHHIDGAEFEVTAGSVGITRLGEAHTIVTTPKGIEIFNIFLDTVRPRIRFLLLHWSRVSTT